MFIQNDTGLSTDTRILDDNDELLQMVHKVEWIHEANQLPIANIYCHKPTIKSRVNGHIKFNTTAYTRQQKEVLIKQLEMELDK